MARFSEEQKALLDQVMHTKICEAATQIIMDHGVEDITMSRVAETAGVAKGTLYNYFKNKDTLLTCTENSIFEPLKEDVAVIAASDLTALLKLREIAKIILEHFSRYKKLLVLLQDSKMNKERFKKREELVTIIEKIITPAIKSGEVRALKSRIVAEIFLGMFMSINISKITSENERSLQQDLDAVMTIFTKGIQLNITNSEV
ncbi:MAG: TetR/AcrR family transcriptional regulator [Victivallales bacterium]|nr:TetR/AcrR family transcriptional regulator [Victivallales bacterium]